MNKNSITAKISIFFAIFIVLILVIAGGALKAHMMHTEHKFFERVLGNIDILSTTNPDTYLPSLEATILSINETKEIITTQEPKRKLPPPPPKEHARDRNFIPPPIDFHRFELYGGFFTSTLVVDINNTKIGLKDNSVDSTFYFYFTLILGGILAAVLLLYLAIIRSLTPLKILEKEIEAFGLGIKPQMAKNYPNNEKGNIQKAFHAVSNKIAGLLDAREIFLKNAAHELKTPIAKGVIVAHMVEGDKQQARLLEIFSSMTQIIDGIMTTEELIAKGFSPKIEPILLRSFCEKIRKKLLLNSADILIEIAGHAIVMADAKLLEIALANLLENAVKFKDKTATCAFEHGKIIIKNSGAKLEEPMDKYFEPFYKETSIRNENGMGLGLYLTKKVLEIQGLRLSYEYRDGENRFIIG